MCISHSTGAGGEEVGRIVAERLGFVYVDSEIVARAAARAGVDASDVAGEERRKPLVARVLEAMAGDGGEAWATHGRGPVRVPGEPTSEGLRALVRETIEQVAAQGNVVIVAHAASHAVSPGPDAMRVLVTASPTTRARRLGSYEDMEPTAAARAVKESDRGRRDYLRRFYDVDEELPTHYDVVVNTDVLSPDRAAELVVRAAS